ncbi:MAG TPA: P1 family peptidase [Kiloniellales bacterium]
MIRPGPRNLITDVSGLAVGNAEDHGARTGVTVVLPDTPAVAATDVRGGAPGTRETDALDPRCLVERVDAIVLSGGSAFGLDAASGVTAWLRRHGRGFKVGKAAVPIVPAAILFDLNNGGDKAWGDEPPYRALGQRAADAATQALRLGNAGAGLGAHAGPLKGGLGSASFQYRPAGGGDGYTIGALAAVNCFGSVLMPQSATFWAWALEQDGELGGQTPPAQAIGGGDLDAPFEAPLGAHTTLAVVATDAALSKAQAGRIAIMAHDGFARAIRPVHTPFDGDSIFVLSTGQYHLANPAADIGRIGMLAADCVARAVARGVFEAETLDNQPSYRAVYGNRLHPGKT